MKTFINTEMDFSLHCILHLFMLSTCAHESEFSQRIKHKNYESAVLGGNVTIFCNLTSLAGVEQITWQKIQGSLPRDIGTYSHKYGEKILPPYADRLQCKIMEPSASFITIQEVTFEDEACYKCLFNTFPHGSHGVQTCLNVLTISELVTELQPVPGSEDLLNLHCSAVGKPAPQISIEPSDVFVHPPEEFFAENPNTTVTVTKTHNISLENMTSLGIQHLVVSMTHPLRSENKTIPLPVAQKGTRNTSLIWKTAIVSIIFFCIVIAALCYYFQKKRSKKKPKPSSTQMTSLLSTQVPTPPSEEAENLMSHHRQTKT